MIKDRKKTYKLGLLIQAICDTLLETLEVLGDVSLLLQEHSEVKMVL